MTEHHHGNPCWYELTTSKNGLKPAEDFYAAILGWTFQDSGMKGFDYHLAQSDGDTVAGVMPPHDEGENIPPHWMIYFAVADADAFVDAARAAGATVRRGPNDVPGTGRFALLADPQGASFGILQPDTSKMSDAEIAKIKRGEGAFQQTKPGHGAWNELMSTDPAAAFAFYSKLLGWTKGAAIDMGKMGTYQLVQHEGVDIGGMMGLGDAPVPKWLPYFGVRGRVSDAVSAVKSAGGSIHHGPVEVPGGGHIAVGQDPQGAWFAVTSSEK